MAGPRKGTGKVLVIVGCLLITLVVVWDLASPDSVVRGLFGGRPDPAANVRALVDDVRGR